MRSRIAVLLAAAGLTATTLAAAPAATALPTTSTPAQSPTLSAAGSVTQGSIVFIKNHNIHLVRGNGSGLYKVTTNGTASTPYTNPTMSDNGIIAVERGSSIVVMRQNGAVLSTMAPRDLFFEGAGTTVFMTEPGWPVISPDGTKFAYSQIRTRRNFENKLVTESLTSFTTSTRLVPLNTYGLIQGSTPSWLTNNRVVLGKSGDLHVFTLGQSDTQRWFHTNDVYVDWPWFDMSDPEISPDGKHYLIAADGADEIKWGDVTGPIPSSLPTIRCSLTSDQPKGSALSFFSAPSWGPDSDTIAYEELGDLWVVTNTEACNTTTATKKIVNGGTSPDWSPAALAPPARAIALRKRPAISGIAKVGRTLRVTKGAWSPTPSSYRFQWLRNGRSVKGATRSTYKLGRSDRGKKIRAKVTVRRSGYTSSVGTTYSRSIK